MSLYKEVLFQHFSLESFRVKGSWVNQGRKDILERGEGERYSCVRSWDPPNPDVATITSVRAQTSHNRKLQPICAGGSACALFSFTVGRAWEFLQYYLSSFRPTVQPSKGQDTGKNPNVKQKKKRRLFPLKIIIPDIKTVQSSCSICNQMRCVMGGIKAYSWGHKHITAQVFYLVILSQVWNTWSAQRPEPPPPPSACCWWSPPEERTGVKPDELRWYRFPLRGRSKVWGGKWKREEKLLPKHSQHLLFSANTYADTHKPTKLQWTQIALQYVNKAGGDAAL